MPSKTLKLPRAVDNRRKARTLAEMQEETRAARLAKEAAELAAQGSRKRQAKAAKSIQEAGAVKRKGTMLTKRAENAERLLAETASRLEQVEQELAARQNPDPLDQAYDQFNMLARGGEELQNFEGGMQPQETTRSARRSLYDAFDTMGGAAELAAWGKKNPEKFYPIWARLVPTEVEDESKKLPLETLLQMLASHADIAAQQAAERVGAEIVGRGGEEIDIEAAVQAYKGTMQ